MTTPVDAYCPGCGQPAERCAGDCGRARDPRFCTTCGRRLREVVVFPGVTDRRCPHHGGFWSQ